MKISITTNTDKKGLLDQATAAVTRLNAIIAMTSMTTTQMRVAIQDMAKYERAIIKRLIQI